MNFEQFAFLHGLIINRLVEGRWHRVPTVDKPKHRNGAYKFMGDFGVLQNWATMTEPVIWRPDADAPKVQARKLIIDTTVQDQKKAAEKAEWILSQCELLGHPYMASKGFPDTLVNVWSRKGQSLMVVPMRFDGRVSGCQIIDEKGQKKFLAGSKTSGATFAMGKGVNVLCEGYATGLTVHEALRRLRVSACVHVCFSAGNMLKVASGLKRGIVIVDNDKSGTGQRAAEQIGWSYWMSDEAGEDCNDFMIRVGMFNLTQQLRKVIHSQNQLDTG
jgi:putative DNA primase/helicase